MITNMGFLQEYMRLREIGMKNIVIFIFFFSLQNASMFLYSEPLRYESKGEAVLLINAEANAILFEKNAHVSVFPASTTKIATALYALKLGSVPLNQPIEAEQDSIGTLSGEAKRKMNYKGAVAYRLEPDGTHIGIKKGEILSFENLLRGMLIASGNDAANVIAQALGPTIPCFMQGMNEYLKELGCKNTHFTNPHGLHDPSHQTTAYDLFLMAREALKNPLICDIVAQTRFVRPQTNKQSETVYLQGNRLLRSGKFYYSKAIGIKTGYHSKSKHTFVGAARDGQRTLIIVLLGYQDRSALFQEAIELFDMAFNQKQEKKVFIPEGPQSFSRQIPKSSEALRTYLKESLELTYFPAEEPKAKPFLYWYSANLPLLKDQAVGEVRLVAEDQSVLKAVPLYAMNDVKVAMIHQVLENWKWGSAIAGLLICGFIFLRRRG